VPVDTADVWTGQGAIALDVSAPDVFDPIGREAATASTAYRRTSVIHGSYPGTPGIVQRTSNARQIRRAIRTSHCVTSSGCSTAVLPMTTRRLLPQKVVDVAGRPGRRRYLYPTGRCEASATIIERLESCTVLRSIQSTTCNHDAPSPDQRQQQLVRLVLIAGSAPKSPGTTLRGPCADRFAE